MSKVKELTSEQISLAERVKINARKMRLAGIGLISVADSESSRLYRQISDLGKPIGGPDTLFGQISRFSSGAFNLAMEESQKRFDELVEEGESAINNGRLTLFWNPLEKKNTKVKTTKAKTSSSKSAGKKASAEAKPDNSPATEKKSAKPKAKKSRPRVAPLETLPDNLKVEFEDAQQQISDQGVPSQVDALELRSLEKQVTEGDVKGRRPAQNNEQACAEFDARKAVKGMKAEEAAARYISLVKREVAESDAAELPEVEARASSSIQSEPVAIE